MKHLFELPEYEDAFHCFIHKTVHELMRQKDPVLSRIAVEYSDDIKTSQNTMPSGEVVESSPFKFRMPFAIEFDEVIIGRCVKLIEAINDAAEEGLKVLMPQFFDQLSRLSAAAGTSTDAKGQPFTWALLLKAWEKMEIEFDENGKSQLSLVVGPGTHLPPPTQEEQQAMNELLKRKRAEFDARQRRRKLS
jgi:hypothetical protein